ncbi:Protein ecdysoneless like [Actinidia chinensis var. chinensis]|uniref:Protein ecdysoneless like n=1 Tax=Actinidia chinensis var. chinensis TaxID=1590841 RepID=A0A2R6S310_ACTCC|nr:Protein ecdysoneless like [Actinidia chinensis var. chinensis]
MEGPTADTVPDPFASIFSHNHSRLPDDTVFFSIFPDLSLTTTAAAATASAQLQSLHLQILHSLSPHTSAYLWQHEPFTLSLSTATATSCLCSSSNHDNLPHLHGKLRFGDNLDDEWFVVALLFHVSRLFPDLSVRVWDTDGDFLLIEAAFHLPRWINPDTSANRVFIRGGELQIIDKNQFPSNATLRDSLSYLINCGNKSRASDSVQSAIKNRIGDFPEKAMRNMHTVRVRVPVSVAQVLKHEPCLISLAVEGFYDRDIDSMKFAAKMERFLSNRSGEEIVEVCVRMSRAMYAQLVQQNFQAPKCYPMPPRSETRVYAEAELGMKIACGFEMVYQSRRREGLEGKGSTWEAFRESLESSGYFEGLLAGSKEHRRLMENAQEYYKNSSVYSRAGEMMSAPVRRIDEILAFPHSSDDFRGQELPPSDDDSWLYNGEDELNAALLERQKEMELYNSKHKGKQKLKEQQDSGPSSDKNLDDFGLGEIAKSMQAFVHKMSSYKGAEVPENRNLEAVDFDVDRFMKDMESVMGHQVSEDASSNLDIEEGSSSDSDMDFDDSEDGSDIEPSENNEEADAFMGSYSDALNEELRVSTLNRSFVRAQAQSLKTNEGTSNATEGVDAQGKSNAAESMDEEFTPVDVDVNLVKSFLDSFSSQQGLPGPASNLLGLMGLHLPQDPDKHK